MSPVLITYPTWKEMFGDRPSYDELLKEIQKFDKTHTAWFISRLNMLLALGRFHSQEIIPIQNLMLGLLIDEDLLGKMKKTFGTERIDERQPFHSLQFLLLLKLVLLEAGKTGNRRPDSDRQAGPALGRCLVMANDLLSSDTGLHAIKSERASERRRRLALLLQLGSGFEVNNPPDIVAAVARSELIFGEILQKTQCSLNIPAVFRSQTGIGLDEYVDFIFGTLAGDARLVPRKPPGWPSLCDSGLCKGWAALFSARLSHDFSMPCDSVRMIPINYLTNSEFPATMSHALRRRPCYEAADPYSQLPFG